MAAHGRVCWPKCNAVFFTSDLLTNPASHAVCTTSNKNTWNGILTFDRWPLAVLYFCCVRMICYSALYRVSITWTIFVFFFNWKMHPKREWFEFFDIIFKSHLPQGKKYKKSWKTALVQLFFIVIPNRSLAPQMDLGNAKQSPSEVCKKKKKARTLKYVHIQVKLCAVQRAPPPPPPHLLYLVYVRISYHASIRGPTRCKYLVYEIQNVLLYALSRWKRLY